jgi:hypothetical protein
MIDPTSALEIRHHAIQRRPLEKLLVNVGVGSPPVGWRELIEARNA